MKLAKVAWVEPSGASHVALREPLGEVEPCYAHVAKSCSAWCNVGPFSDSSEAGLANGDTTLSLKFEDVGLGRPCTAHFEAMCASTWAKVAPKRSSLGPSCAMLDPSWAEVKSGTKLDEVRALLAQVGPKVERMLQPCWIETVNCDDVVPVCKRCKSRQSRTLFSGSCAS